MTADAIPGIATWYRTFAQHEAGERSPLYAELAGGIARDAEVLALLAQMPPIKRQPNLLLGVYRLLFGLASGWNEFRATLLANWEEISGEAMRRRTQTNEPQRCAVLLPVLAQLPQPLAIVEVGASAGLCLYPDLYGFDYGARALAPAGGRRGPVFPCSVAGPAPLPACHPQIAWRAGLDLNPLDPRDPEAMEWLQLLVWPGQDERAARLAEAIAVAAEQASPVLCGDLLSDLPALMAEAPRDATKVVFHTAVLNYVGAERREDFAAIVAEHADHWISNEGPGVFLTHRPFAPAPRPEMFVLALDRKPLAWTNPHGAALHWIG